MKSQSLIVNKSIKTMRKKSSAKSNQSNHLYQIVESFHNTLCCLPLNSLLSNANSDKWLHQQKITLNQLFNKLNLFEKDPQYKYYLAKLDSVKTLLNNIQQNLSMLEKIKLCNYNSSGSSSLNDSKEHKSSKQSYNYSEYDSQQNSNIRDLHNGLLSFDRYEIQSQKLMKETDLSEVPTIKMNNFEKLYETQLKKYQVSVKNLQTKRSQNEIYKINSMNTQQTISKNVSKHEDDYKFLKQPSTQSIIYEIQSNRDHLKQEQQQFERLLIKDEQLNIYKDEIKEIKETLSQKDRIIELYLMKEQQYQNQIGLLKEKLKEKTLECCFYGERVNLMENTQKNNGFQIEDIKIREKELRQTIKHQQSRYQKLQYKNNELENKLTTQYQQKQSLSNKLNQSRIQLTKTKKQLKIQKQKTQIYKQKYFKILNENKQNDNTVSNSLKTIIYNHKCQLAKIDK